MPRLDAFIEAACVPRGEAHRSGTLDQAQAMLIRHPEIAGGSIHAAAILGDPAGVHRFLELDTSPATSPGGPYGWDPLTCLCFSRYLRLDRARSGGFVRAAEALLDAGADPRTGFFDTTHGPAPQFESALYGAAGVAHHAPLTQLLLDRGADPNDEEVPYHAPETHDNAVLRVLVESGRLTADSLATLLLRKADWHDEAGIEYLLTHGADPNRQTPWHYTAFQQAIRRDNALPIIRLMLDRGGDPHAGNRLDGRSAAIMAAHRGRGDVLDLLAERGIALELTGVDGLIAACARGDSGAVLSMAAHAPALVRALLDDGARLLAAFAGSGNADGVGCLVDLGVDVAVRLPESDGYWGLAADTTALHVAAWRARHATVRLLIARGAAVDALDAAGRTPLALAVRATVDSYWSDRRSPESVAALLAAHASTSGITWPTGYAEVDDLLRASG